MSASASPITINLTLHVHVHVHSAPAYVREAHEMDRGTGPGDAHDRSAAESDRAGDQGNLRPEASHAGPGESPGASSEPAASVTAQSEGVRTIAQGSTDNAEAGSAAPAGLTHRDVDQFVTAVGAGEGAPTPVDPGPAPDDEFTAEEPRHDVSDDAGAGEETSHSADPAPAPPTRAPAPREALVIGGHMWRNLRDAYGWPEDEIQERWLRGDKPERHDLVQTEAA